MNQLLIGGIAAATVLSTTAAGYRVGAGSWPDLRPWRAKPGQATAVITAAPAPERKVLYWRHPDVDTDYAAAPNRTSDGRDYVPVFDDQEADFAGAQPKPPRDRADAGPKRILYYRNPMGLPDTSPVPKKDWMGMDYIAVYEGEEQQGSTVRVSLDRVQRSGVRSEKAEMRALLRPVRAPAIAKPDERTLYTVTLRADGFIEKLYANETGQHLKAGEPMFRVYIPQLVSMQIDYTTAVSATGKGPRSELGPLRRIRNLGVPESVLQQLRASPTPMLAIDWPSPMTGVVMQKKVIEGQMVKAGEEMFRLADLSSIWVIADVPEQEIGAIKIGAPAKVDFRAFPRESFAGRVTFVLHELEMATRTAKVRIEVANPDHRIKHEMFADVTVDAGVGEPDRLTVPLSALIDSGNRQVVIVDRGEGRFEPRPVKVGLRGDGHVEIAEGLAAGEQVVVAATFLIDAESNLKAALAGFTAEPSAKAAKP